MTAINPRFADRAIQLRVERGWSIARLAEVSGLSAGAIDRIERGVRPIESGEALALAAVLGESVEEMQLIRSHSWRPPPNAPELGPLQERACAFMSCGRPRSEHERAVGGEG